MLEAIRILNLEEKTKFYQASTSELYGMVQEVPQKETTPFYPRSPYAVAKLYAYWITVNYREAYGIFASNGILFNHESPLRGETFVTRKITMAAVRIATGKQKMLFLGNLSSERDWGHAQDYVEGMWRILQHDKGDDFVLATGIKMTVRDFVYNCFKNLGIELEFLGSGEDERGIVVSNEGEFIHIKPGQELVKVDSAYYRPTEVDLLIGDASKAKKELGWTPQRDIHQLIEEMVTEDLNRIRSNE